MCRLFETICIRDGVPQHIRWHEQRMRRSGWIPGDAGEPAGLTGWLTVPPEYASGTVRCNIFYDEKIREMAFSHYARKKIRSLRLVKDNTIDYHLKFSDRKALQALLDRRGDADEIIIVKKGLLTDASMANLAFFDGVRWFTPARPLLHGTCRERLLAEGKLYERDIRPSDIRDYAGCKLINAMRGLEEGDFVQKFCDLCG